jgi:hypothetical protein
MIDRAPDKGHAEGMNLRNIIPHIATWRDLEGTLSSAEKEENAFFRTSDDGLPDRKR